MPVSRVTRSQAIPVVPDTARSSMTRPEIVKMIRWLLREARGSYIVWGRMLQGQSGVDYLIESDMKQLVDIVERSLGGS